MRVENKTKKKREFSEVRTLWNCAQVPIQQKINLKQEAPKFPDDDRTTTSTMTKFEKASILGRRQQSLNHNAATYLTEAQLVEMESMIEQWLIK